MISLRLKDGKQLHVICALTLAIYQVVDKHWEVRLVVLRREAVNCQIVQVMRCKLKVIVVNRQQLVNAVQEEYEKGRVVLAVVHIRPRLHLQT